MIWTKTNISLSRESHFQVVTTCVPGRFTSPTIVHLNFFNNTFAKGSFASFATGERRRPFLFFVSSHFNFIYELQPVVLNHYDTTNTSFFLSSTGWKIIFARPVWKDRREDGDLATTKRDSAQMARAKKQKNPLGESKKKKKNGGVYFLITSYLRKVN